MSDRVYPYYTRSNSGTKTTRARVPHSSDAIISETPSALAAVADDVYPRRRRGKYFRAYVYLYTTRVPTVERIITYTRIVVQTE